MLENLTKETCTAQLNTKFRLLHEDSSLELELFEVSGPGIASGQERFYLLFRGPLEAAFEQGIYKIEHEHFGSIELFLVPVAREADGMHYEAVFNRIAKPAH